MYQKSRFYDFCAKFQVFSDGRKLVLEHDWKKKKFGGMNYPFNVSFTIIYIKERTLEVLKALQKAVISFLSSWP